jgi:hypothetical protein
MRSLKFSVVRMSGCPDVRMCLCLSFLSTLQINAHFYGEDFLVSCMNWFPNRSFPTTGLLNLDGEFKNLRFFLLLSKLPSFLSILTWICLLFLSSGLACQLHEKISKSWRWIQKPVCFCHFNQFKPEFVCYFYRVDLLVSCMRRFPNLDGEFKNLSLFFIVIKIAVFGLLETSPIYVWPKFDFLSTPQSRLRNLRVT